MQRGALRTSRTVPARCRYGVGYGVRYGVRPVPRFLSRDVFGYLAISYGATCGVAGFYISGGYQNLTCAARVQLFKPCSVKPASCPRILLAKWAEFVLAARLLNLAGEPIEAVINRRDEQGQAQRDCGDQRQRRARPAFGRAKGGIAKRPRGLKAARAKQVRHRAQLHQGQPPLR